MKLRTPKYLAKTDVVVMFTSGTDENGSQPTDSELSTKARVQQTTSTLFTKDGREVPVHTKVFIFDKLETFPEEITGFCRIGTLTHDIGKGSKKVNPDGSINHVVLELI